MATVVESQPTPGGEIQQEHASIKTQINNFRDAENGFPGCSQRFVRAHRATNMHISIIVLYSKKPAGKRERHCVALGQGNHQCKALEWKQRSQ